MTESLERTPSRYDDGYNGYSNWETWTCQLWLSNTEGLCKIAEGAQDYNHFVGMVQEIMPKVNGDGVAWLDPAVNRAEMDAVIKELKH